MNRLDYEQDELPLRTPVASSSSRDREYTLSTGMVLSIFFALALVCAIFFGFGYTLGRKSMQPAMTADSSTGGDTAAFSKFKPAAGSTSGPSASTYTAPKQDTTPSAQTSATASSVPEETAPRQTAPPQSAAPAAPVVRATPPPAPVAVSAPATGGSTMVQIAAVSHPEDADVLTAALKRRGYSVSTRQEPGDRLIHVQVGPFPTRKDAEVMRQKLLNDGYNAILK